MAEPVFLDASETHPCAQCAGARQVAEMSWRSPSFSVTCLGCNQVIAGETADDAILAWNNVNPDRAVAPEDVQRMQSTQAERLITAPWLAALQAMATAYAATDLPQDVEAFVMWCVAKMPT